MRIITERAEAGLYHTVNTEPIAFLTKCGTEWKLQCGNVVKSQPTRHACVEFLLELAHQEPAVVRIIQPNTKRVT